MLPALATIALAGPWAVAGFTQKVRGERIVYCRFELNIGTRFQTETCIDQAHIPAYLALEEKRRLLRQLGTEENRIV